MFGDGFFKDLFLFFQLIFSGYRFSPSEVLSAILSMITFGLIVGLGIAFLITFIFVLPRKIQNLTEQLQELKIRMDLNNKDNK